jgi:hypothetical protein
MGKVIYLTEGEEREGLPREKECARKEENGWNIEKERMWETNS